MSRVLIIYTGGTIGMIPSSEGYRPSPERFEQALREIRDLNSPDMPGWDVVQLTPLLDSSNVSVENWNQIGRIIAENARSYDGFAVLHGTDTMAYSCSALSFMLRGLNKPVVFTGSQIPLCEIRSDAVDNIVTAVLIAGSGKVREVCLYFGGRLLRGNRAVKISADGLGAFDSPNCPDLADAGILIRYASLPLPRAEEPFAFVPFRQTAIGVLKIFPGIQFDLFEPVITDRLRAVVLETFGTGNVPVDGNALIPVIRKAFSNGAIVVVCSQCVRGAVRLGNYATSTPLKEAGAVCGYDMTTEAAVAKLYYLFSLGLETPKIKELMETDLCGELSR